MSFYVSLKITETEIFFILFSIEGPAETIFCQKPRVNIKVISNKKTSAAKLLMSRKSLSVMLTAMKKKLFEHPNSKMKNILMFVFSIHRFCVTAFFAR